MKRKQFDIMVSYSHMDQNLIEKVVEALIERKILLDYGRWQMKSGDIFRSRILDGIESASYFLIVISENSVGSSWVQYELNAAMIDEIESKYVKVIPSIIGNIDFRQLPPDLRAKYCLDFRSSEAFQKSINAMVDLVQPERRQHEELLTRLRNPATSDLQTIHELRKYVLTYGDQSVQVAAMRGLAKIGGPDAVYIITERVLESWGTRANARAIETLVKLRKDGGLLALTSTLLSSLYNYHEKLRALIKGAKKLGAEKEAQLLTTIYEEAGTIYDLRKSAPSALDKMVNSSIEDIRYGALLAKGVMRARRYSPLPTWAGNITIPESSLYMQLEIMLNGESQILFGLYGRIDLLTLAFKKLIVW